MTIGFVHRGSDLSLFAAIHAQCFPDAWNAKALDELLATPGAFLLASATGFILARVAAGEAEILTLAVSPEARRFGTGAALVTAAAEHAFRLGAGEMFLEVAHGNVAARRLYRRSGFVEAGKRTGYYTAGREGAEDALILRGELPLSALGKSDRPR